jgi:dihydrofolate reductase
VDARVKDAAAPGLAGGVYQLVTAALQQLRAETNGEIEVNGAALAASLVRFGMVDELRLYMMPVVLGGGEPYFEAGLQLELEPLGAESLPQHCTLLRFRPKKS